MIQVREASIEDVEAIRDLFVATYGEHYAYPQYYDTQALTRLVFADGTVLLVAIDTDSRRVVGTASVVFGVGAYADLVGEFGRLAVHPDARGRGIGTLLMKERLERVQHRLHLGLVENRAAHTFSQRISQRFGFVPMGFIPMKLLIEDRESVSSYVRYFGQALALRRNNPRVIPEASLLAATALENCKLPADCIIDDQAAPFPYDEEFDLEELKTEGYAPLLRIERGRVQQRDIFGPVRLHYGLFQLRARDSHYLLASRSGKVAGGIGFMIDGNEKVARIFELISVTDATIRFLLSKVITKCQGELDIEYIEVDVSAYSPRMQRTLLELGFLPVNYIPANVFHEVERLDAVKMAKLLVPFRLGEVKISDDVRPIADIVIRSFSSKDAEPRIAAAAGRLPLFVGLNEEQRNQLIRACSYQSFPRGAKVFETGDEGGTMHLILAGEIDLLVGERRSVGVISTGQCLGETSLLDPRNPPARSITAVARSDVETAVLSNRAFDELVRRRPDIGVVIYRNLATDISSKLKAVDHGLVA